MTMAKFRRIGTTYFEYGDVRVRDRVERERAAILEAISRAGELRVDILLFQSSLDLSRSMAILARICAAGRRLGP